MIYLVKNSPHNEDFILLGYATGTFGIKKIVQDYYKDICPEFNRRMIIVYYDKNEVVVKAVESWDHDQILYLVPIPPIEERK